MNEEVKIVKWVGMYLGGISRGVEVLDVPDIKVVEWWVLVDVNGRHVEGLDCYQSHSSV